MHRVKKTFHIALGLFLLCVGLAGLVLPILDGTLFLLLGIILLSFEMPSLQKALSTLAKKKAYVFHWYQKLDTWMRKIFKI